jgi:ABC-type Fe3+/spermidine/putrescine transport system ATPase subunit
MTVGQNIAFGLETLGRSRTEVADSTHEALALVRMEGLENRFPHEISGGQQQRVALARALAVRPEIILLDEPLSNLDARLRDEIRSELQALHEKLRITMIYVTHDQEDALTLATKIALFRAGEIEQIGTPRQLYERPRTSYAAEFLGGANLIPCVPPCRTPEDGRPPLVSVNLTGALAERSLSAFASEFETDKKTYICVRPENVRISATPHGGEEELGALVRRILYKGSFLDIELFLDEGTVIVARVPSFSDFGDVSVGARVTVSWPSKAATIVTE